jgi:hypothetical protein
MVFRPLDAAKSLEMDLGKRTSDAGPMSRAVTRAVSPSEPDELSMAVAVAVAVAPGPPQLLNPAAERRRKVMRECEKLSSKGTSEKSARL